MHHLHRFKSSTSPEAFHRRDTAPGLVFKASHCEITLKADAEAGEPEGTISGYGSKFGLVDSYNETMKKGAFRSSLAEWRKRKKPIPMLWQHMGNEPIGAWTEYKEDDTGLLLKGSLLLELPRAKEALTLIKANVVTGLSIGYMEIDADPWWDPEREGAREVRKVDLRETSVVTFPALREAQLDAVKSRVARGERPTLREFQRWMQRELGLSRSEAEEIANIGYKEWVTRECGPEATRDDASVAGQRELDAVLAQLSTPIL